MPLTCAHLVGSLPYPDADTTFTENRPPARRPLEADPDGETGERSRWIYWQRAKVAAHPAMEVAADEDKARIHQWDGKLIREWELFRFRAGVDPAAVEFDPGYAPEAIASYARFVAMRGAGTLPAGVRFQVCLPTPMAIGYWFVSPSARPDFFAAYERAFRADLAKICAAIPRDDLAIQWDVCQEVLAWEGYFPNPARKLQGGHHRHAGPARERGAGAGRARLPPLLRDAERRARRHADRPRQHGRDHARPPSPGSRGRSSTSTSRRRSTGTTKPTTRRSPPSASPRAATSTSASSTTTIATATGAASRPRRGSSRTSASRPSAAGAAAIRPAPPASSTATASRSRASDSGSLLRLAQAQRPPILPARFGSPPCTKTQTSTGPLPRPRPHRRHRSAHGSD